MALQQPHREWRAARVRASVHLAEECVGEQRDILLSRAQGRQLDTHDIQPVVQVVAEATRFHLGAKVSVGCGNHAHVDRHRPRRPHRRDLPLLQHAQQPVLHAPDMSPTSYSKIVPPSADSNKPLRSRTAPLNAPRMCPKSSDSSRPSASGGAVDRDERSLGTIRALVKRARDELLPRTCFAGHQNGGGRRGSVRGPPAPCVCRPPP